TTPPPPTSTLFPYTTLFRSWLVQVAAADRDLLPHAARQFRAERVPLLSQLETDKELRATGFPGPEPVRRRDEAKVLPNGELIERSEEHTSELQSRFDLVCRL